MIERDTKKEVLIKTALVTVSILCITVTIATLLGIAITLKAYKYAGRKSIEIDAGIDYIGSKKEKIDGILFNTSSLTYHANSMASSLKLEVQEREERARTIKSLNFLLASLTQNSQDFNEQTLPKVTEGIASLAVATQNVGNLVVRTDASLNNEDGLLPQTGQVIANLNRLANLYNVRSDEILAELLNSAKHTDGAIVQVNDLLHKNSVTIEGIFNDVKVSSENLVRMSEQGAIASEQLPAFTRETTGSVTEVRKFVAGLNRQQKVSFIVGVLIQAARSALTGM